MSIKSFKNNKILGLISNVSTKVLSLNSIDELSIYITQKLISITNAEFATFNHYDSSEKIFKMKHFELNPQHTEKSELIEDIQPTQYGIIITDEQYRKLQSENVIICDNLDDVPVCIMPHRLTESIISSFGIRKIVFINYFFENVFFGTTILGLKDEIEHENIELLKTISALVWGTFVRFKKEMEIKENEQKYFKMLDGIHDVFYRCDASGKILMCSASGASVLGFDSIDNIIGKNIADDFYYNKGDRTLFIQELIENTYINGYRVVLKKKDGTPIIIATNSHFIYDENGNVIGIEGILQDVTQKQRSEDILLIQQKLSQMSKNSTINDMIQFSIDEICRLTFSPIGFFHSVIEEEKTIVLQEWSTRTKNEFCKAQGKGEHYSLDRAGVWADCIRERKAIIHNNFKELENKKGLPDDHAEIIRELVVPIVRHGKIVAVLGVGNKNSIYLNEDIDIISHLADKVWELIERKRTEEALVNSEAKLRNFISQSMEGIIIVDENGKIEEWNKTSEIITGITYNKAHNQYWWDIGIKLLPKEKQTVEAKAALERIVKSILVHGNIGKYSHSNFTITHSDETVKYIEQSLFTFKTSIGFRIAAILIDVTSKKLAEIALKESEEQYRLLADNIFDVIWTVDINWQAKYVSPSIKKMLGWEPYEWHNCPFLKYVAPEFHNDVLKLIEEKVKMLQNSDPKAFEPVMMEVKQIHKNGSLVWTEVSGQFMLDDKKQPIGVIGITRDITERKAAESHRKMLEEQLLQTQKLESIGRLSGGVAHDLNNMMTPILGYAEILMLELENDEDKKRKIQQMINGVLNSRDLVRQLLAFARKQTLEMIPTNVNEIITEFKVMIQRTIRENINISFNLANDIGIINADKIQLQQIIMNLCINAQDAMPEGGALFIKTSNVYIDETYTIERREVKPGHYVLITINDTGYGMDKETQAKAFEPFFTTKTIGRGTGLGLATVYGIVNQHGGHIFLYSELNKGTSIKVYFPIINKELIYDDIKSDERKNIKGNETIFVIEDQKDVRDMIIEFLNILGYKVYCAFDGISAIEIFKQYELSVDLLITDIILPDINGKEIYDIIAKTNPKQKVLYMSGYSEEVITVHNILQQGINFIQKPFSLKEFHNKIRNILDNP